MERIAVFPGTFDPITNGHIDLITRASKIFDKLVIAVAASPSKHTMFDLNTRVQMCKKALASLPNIKVEGFDGMLVVYLKSINANILLRGVRTAIDFEYESQLSNMYRVASPNIDMVILPPNPTVSFISSTLVREVILHQGDVSKFVPQEITDLIKENYTN